MICNEWTIERRSILPKITATGTSDKKEAEPYLITEAVDLISKAAKFKGVAIGEEPTQFTKVAIVVQITLIFPNENQLNQFMDLLKQTDSGDFGSPF